MIELLHSLLIGIAFAAGVGIGAILTATAIKRIIANHPDKKASDHYQAETIKHMEELREIHKGIASSLEAIELCQGEIAQSNRHIAFAQNT